MSEHPAQPAFNQEREYEESSTRILERLGLTLDELEGGTVLDIGCGNGALARIAGRRGIEVTSVDIDPYRSRAADLFEEAVANDPEFRKRYDAASIDEVHDVLFPEFYEKAKREELDIPNFVQADALHLPFQDNSFSRIVCHGFPPLWEGTPEERRAYVIEQHRVLAPGGMARFGPELWDSEAAEPTTFDSLPFPITKGPVVEEGNLRQRYYSFTK